MSERLHEKQLTLLRYLKGVEDLEGQSYWQIARETGLKNAQTVKHHFLQLENRGYLRRDLNDPSKFEILKTPIEDLVYINLYGFAQCGNDADFFSEGNLEDRIAISTKLLGISDLRNTFSVKARGDSMLPDILENDIVIFQKQSSVDNGSIALVVVNESVKIKQVLKESSHKYILRSTNRSQYPDKIITTKDDFYILGSARRVIKSL